MNVLNKKLLFIHVEQLLFLGNLLICLPLKPAQQYSITSIPFTAQ